MIEMASSLRGEPLLVMIPIFRLQLQLNQSSNINTWQFGVHIVWADNLLMLTCPSYKVSRFLFSLLCRTWDCWLFRLFAYRWCGLKDIDWTDENSQIPWTKEDGNKKDRDDVEVDCCTIPFLNLIVKWRYCKLEKLAYKLLIGLRSKKTTVVWTCFCSSAWFPSAKFSQTWWKYCVRHNIISALITAIPNISTNNCICPKIPNNWGTFTLTGPKHHY